MTRLSICGLLAAGPQWVEFSVVRDTVGVSDSVLSKQSRILEDAGYLEVRKGAVGRRPRTWFRLTPEGRTAFAEHLTWLQNAAQLAADRAPADGGGDLER
ncbi:transcriptional regulator [Streptomyces prunicolor]|uniref:winged helix-turn-helix domain-containing protein n=1 Tax=Streptomyces prunicolor TaxID=67348 RepID=UPI00386D388B|nr:transcriptional regulator [Streptomyces prunicolor]